MRRKTFKLNKIKKRICNLENDIYVFSKTVTKLFELYYPKNVLYFVEKGNPFIIVNNDILFFFVKDLSEMYQSDFSQVQILKEAFFVSKTYICLNDQDLDVDLFSEFPAEDYIGLARKNVIQVIDVLLSEEQIMKRKIVCPFCGSRLLVYTPFIKRGFVSGRLSFKPNEMLDATKCLDELCKDANTNGVFLTCKNCYENFEFSMMSENPTSFVYKTPISKKEFMDSISLVCSDRTVNLVMSIKEESKTFYKEEVDEIINEFKNQDENSDIEEFILNVKNAIDGDDDDDF